MKENEIALKRTKLKGRNIYIVSFRDLLRIIDKWSGDITKVVSIVPFPSINKYGTIAPDNVYAVAKFLADKMDSEHACDLFGNGLILGSTESYINYIWLNPQNTPDYIGNETIKYISENYSYDQGVFSKVIKQE